jgi:ketosteroid isomerase-like protein
MPALSEFFSCDYIQIANGERLDYAGFINHARALKRSLATAKVTFERIIVDGDDIAEIHVLNGTKHDGTALRVKVIAFYRLKDGKIVEVDELTHLLEGAEADRDIGFRQGC